MSLKYCKKLFTGGTTPIFPETGSTITAAMSSPYVSNACLTPSGSLYGTVILCLTMNHHDHGNSLQISIFYYDLYILVPHVRHSSLLQFLSLPYEAFQLKERGQ